MTGRVRFGRRSAPVRLVAVTTAAALLATLLSVNVLANSNKPYTVSGTPHTIFAGSNTSISITVTDTTKTQQLGSLEIDLSASGFTFESVAGSYATVTSTDSNSSPTVGLVNPSMLQVQGLNLQPDESATIKIANLKAPGCTPLQWTFTAQQANQWSSGNGANYLTLAGSQPVSAADPCHLAFSVQPADAGASQTITNTPLTPSGAGVQAVTVQVLDSNNQPAAFATGVKLALNTVHLDAAGGSPALANGGPTGTDSATGAATFQPSVNVGGAFTLTATAPSNPAITPATSGQFRIWGTAATCDTDACDLQLASTNGQTLNQTSDSTTGAIGASFNIVAFDCLAAKYGGVGAISGTNSVTWTTYNAASSGSKETGLFIPDALLSNAGILGVHYMVCFSAPYQFPVAWTPASLTTGFDTAQPDSRVSDVMGGTWYTGLLPDCQDVGGYADHAPCVYSRIHANGGLTVTVQSSAGDPFLR